MGKDKLRKFAENETFPNVIQPEFEEMFSVDYKLKGKWQTEFWKNNKPITLELGCGKGEYAVNMARFQPERNYLGIDVKGARFWRGAKTAVQDNIPNVAFLRTRIEFISSFFAANEVDEIWITFPDPQLKSRRHKKRLTSSIFLNRYKQFIKPNAIIHLKTDSLELHQDTVTLLRHNGIEPMVAVEDLYASPILDEVLSIKTHYEAIYLKEGKKITYLKFNIPTEKVLKEIE
jgi:tRNA (guanine-N7-)-methyltransferase